MPKLQQCKYFGSLITKQTNLGHNISFQEAADDNRKDANI